MITKPRLNIRTKGASGEREVCVMLNGIIRTVMIELEYGELDIQLAEKIVQRNQNQTAVGGCDLVNTFGISFEVKRQEQLSIGSWWAQCKAAADVNKELPVLIYRQNHKPWRVRTYGFLHVPETDISWGQYKGIIEIDVITFKEWFAIWVRGKLQSGFNFRI